MTTKEQKKNTHQNEKEQITYLGRGLHQSVGQQECVGSVKITDDRQTLHLHGRIESSLII